MLLPMNLGAGCQGREHGCQAASHADAEMCGVLNSVKFEASYFFNFFFPSGHQTSCAFTQQFSRWVGGRTRHPKLAGSARGEMAVSYNGEGEPRSVHLPSEELERNSSGCLKLFLLFLPLTSFFLPSLCVSRSGPDSEIMWEREDASSARQGVGLEQS